MPTTAHADHEANYAVVIIPVPDQGVIPSPSGDDYDETPEVHVRADAEGIVVDLVVDGDVIATEYQTLDDLIHRLTNQEV